MSAVETLAPDEGPPGQGPVTLPRAVQFDMVSRLNGRAYRIFVAAPLLPPPPEGYAVIVTSDGNLSFPIAAQLAGMNALGGGKKAVVVSVGYPSENPLELSLLRRRDLTPPTPLQNIQPVPGWPEPTEADFGGAEDFYRFLVEELRPAIAAGWQVDPADQTLYGHSLGGLLTLHVLFAHPDSFRNFVASSPSIWWNERAILADVPAFARRVEAGEVTPRVLITIGATEQEPPKALPPGMTQEDANQRIAQARMVDNAADLGGRLAALKGAPGYEARYRGLDEDDHSTSLGTSIARAISFALRD